MNKKTAIIMLLAVNLSYLFLYIDKQNRFIKISFENQRLEKRIKELTEYKESLTQQRYALNQQSTIKSYAADHLGMRPISLHSIITFTNHE